MSLSSKPVIVRPMAKQKPTPVAGADAQLLQTLVRAFYEVSAAANLQMRTLLDGLHLTEAMAGLLWMLDPALPPASMRELARGLGCDPSNVTLIGDKIEQAGLAVRQVNPNDARSRNLTLTAAGLTLRAQLFDQLVALTPLASLSRAEQQQLVSVLYKLGATP